MASILKVDEMQGVTDANAVTLSPSNVTITLDDGSTTSQLQSALSKVWVRYNSSADTIGASLNVSSIADNGTGQTYVNFGVTFTASDGYAAVNTTNNWNNYVASYTTTSCQSISGNASHNQADSDNNQVIVTGDLA